MPYLTNTKSKRRPSVKLTVGFAISAILALGTFAGSADAQHYYNGHYYNGGYYRAPPVVYGSPYGGDTMAPAIMVRLIITPHR
jgi:hypothetical protein